MILSDRTIREELAAGRIVIDPLDPPASSRPRSTCASTGCSGSSSTTRRSVIDVKRNLEELTRLVEIDPDDAFILHPGEFVLGSTFELVGLPDDLVARIEGKSSLGRLGLLIHSTAGFIDAGLLGPHHPRASATSPACRSRCTPA